MHISGNEAPVPVGILECFYAVSDKRNRNPEHKAKEGTKQAPRDADNAITPGEAMPAFNGQTIVGFL
jgi:hypothetical protein